MRVQAGWAKASFAPANHLLTRGLCLLDLCALGLGLLVDCGSGVFYFPEVGESPLFSSCLIYQDLPNLVVLGHLLVTSIRGYLQTPLGFGPGGFWTPVVHNPRTSSYGPRSMWPIARRISS